MLEIEVVGQHFQGTNTLVFLDIFFFRIVYMLHHKTPFLPIRPFELFRVVASE